MLLLARRKSAKNQNVLTGKVANAVAAGTENNFQGFLVFDTFFFFVLLWRIEISIFLLFAFNSLDCRLFFMFGDVCAGASFSC